MSALPLTNHRHRSKLDRETPDQIRVKLAQALRDWEDAMMAYDELNRDLRRNVADYGRQTIMRRDVPVFRDTLDAFEFATTKVHVYAEALRFAEDQQRRFAVAGARPPRTMPDNGAGYGGRRVS